VSPEYLDGLFRVAGREHGIPDFHQEEPRESVTSGPEIALRERGDHEKGYRYFIGGEKQ
jgi:hypothetical protein